MALSFRLKFLPGTQSKVVSKTGWHFPTSTKLKTENYKEFRIKKTMNEIEMSDVTYCLFSKASFCSGRDWHRDRHRSISSVASFWLTGTILLVDGLPNLARRLLASTGFTAASKIARMKIILIAETIFMAIEIEIFRIICLIMKIMKILRRISHF